MARTGSSVLCITWVTNAAAMPAEKVTTPLAFAITFREWVTSRSRHFDVSCSELSFMPDLPVRRPVSIAITVRQCGHAQRRPWTPEAGGGAAAGEHPPRGGPRPRGRALHQPRLCQYLDTTDRRRGRRTP